MEFRDVIGRRRMVRAYDPARPVPVEAVTDLLSAALGAPSAGNTQGVTFLVLDTGHDLDAYWQLTTDDEESDAWLRGMRTAPLLILVWTSRESYLDRYAEPDKGWVDRDPERWSAPYWFVDAGMASMAALLSAVNARLGACFFGIPTGKIPAVRRAFGVPEDQLSVGVLSVGYPASDRGATGSASRPRRKGRVRFGSWSRVSR